MTKPILYIDMDNVLVNFQTGIAKLDEETRVKYQGNYDEVPHIFSKMEPTKGAIEAVNQLAEHYDIYALSTAPWNNPTAWSDKIEWIQKLLLEYLKEETVIFKELSRDLHIEHILPQEWKRDDLNWSEFFTENEAKKYLNSLGNLTLLKGSKNIQASNSNFSDKRDVYKGKYDSKANSFALTREITDKYRKWNPKSIEKRQKEMIEEIINYLEF